MKIANKINKNRKELNPHYRAYSFNLLCGGLSAIQKMSNSIFHIESYVIANWHLSRLTVELFPVVNYFYFLKL
jgi:hypothetical protein